MIITPSLSLYLLTQYSTTSTMLFNLATGADYYREALDMMQFPKLCIVSICAKRCNSVSRILVSYLIHEGSTLTF